MNYQYFLNFLLTNLLIVRILCPLCNKNMKFDSLRTHIIKRNCKEVHDNETINAFLNAWRQFLEEMKKKVPITAEDHKYKEANKIIKIFKKGNKFYYFLISFIDGEGIMSEELVEAGDFLLSRIGKSLLNKVYYQIKKKFVPTWQY